MKLSLANVRRLALKCQGLDGGWDLPDGKLGALEVVNRLGYAQIDTLHVVQRAHHHVVWSRFPEYRPEMLHELLVEDRQVFEWWTHAASYIPMNDFRFFAPRMSAHALNPRHKAWIAENQDVLDHVVARIRQEGALGTSDFQTPEGHTNASWWSGWKPAKRALEVLFNQGTMLVSARRNFERLYDLRERIVPEGVDRPEPDQTEMDDYVLRRSLGSLGALPEREVRLWHSTRPSKTALQRAVDAGLVTLVEVADDGDEPWYVWTAALPALDVPTEARLHILSPFDNLIIRRPLVERIYGFHYRMECYVPKAKRKYGYFSLPVLWGDRFVARVDIKADRASKTLIVRHLYFEPDFAAYDEVLEPLAQELHAFAAFNACDDFAVEKVTPLHVQDSLVRELDRV
jgi:uncharacterized protein YcaQ